MQKTRGTILIHEEIGIIELVHAEFFSEAGLCFYFYHHSYNLCLQYMYKDLLSIYIYVFMDTK